jgi:hypothetical protein
MHPVTLHRLSLALVLAAQPVLFSGCSHGAPPAPTPQPAPRPQPAPTPTPQPAPQTDPYGFGPWLNAERARRGLTALAYDPSLVPYAAQNTAQQCARGLGHWGPGGFPTGYPYVKRENAGMGPLGQVEPMWVASPAHASALFDPSVRFYGIAGQAGYWTYNAR